ncbi:uncharacterized protein LOC8038856 [Ixodes scapularis]|uniref:uncharacterized protein LOC8038856 n=1 Tax=Ixodes scapularis TaxID=6945 RepID=UPI001C39272A|nr:uncharacterized protein LOC8038856 [Ixodes scapularis]
MDWRDQPQLNLEYLVKVPRVELFSQPPLQAEPRRPAFGETPHCLCPPFECVCGGSPITSPGPSRRQDYRQAPDPCSMANMMSSAIEMHADSVFQVIDKILSSDKAAPKDHYEFQCTDPSNDAAFHASRESSSGIGDDSSTWRTAAKNAGDFAHPASFMVLEQPARPEAKACSTAPHCDEDYVLTSLDDPDISQRFFAAIDNILQDYGGEAPSTGWNGEVSHAHTLDGAQETGGTPQELRVKGEHSADRTMCVYFHAGGGPPGRGSWQHGDGHPLRPCQAELASFGVHPMP